MSFGWTHLSLHALRMIVAWRNLSNYLSFFLQILLVLTTGCMEDSTSTPSCIAFLYVYSTFYVIVQSFGISVWLFEVLHTGYLSLSAKTNMCGHFVTNVNRLVHKRFHKPIMAFDMANVEGWLSTHFAWEAVGRPKQGLIMTDVC